MRQLPIARYAGSLAAGYVIAARRMVISFAAGGPAPLACHSNDQPLS
jgi:hypothetical protein